MGDRWDDLAERMPSQDFKVEWGGRVIIRGDNRPAKTMMEAMILDEARRWRENFVPVSERLRLHYIEGAHAGLRGEWARIIREETAVLAETSRRYRRYRRDMRDQQRVGQYLPPLTGYGRRGYHIDQEVF